MKIIRQTVVVGLVALLFGCGANQEDIAEMKRQLLDSLAKNESTVQAGDATPINSVVPDAAKSKIVAPNKFDVCKCFVSVSNSSLAFSLCSSKEGTFVKYKGQEEFLELLNYDNKESEGPLYTNFETYYSEIIYVGEVIGNYKFVRSGNNEECTYTRKKDGKVFNFMMDLEASYPDGESRKVPCY